MAHCNCSMNVDSYPYSSIHLECFKLGVVEFTYNIGGAIISLDIRYLNITRVYVHVHICDTYTDTQNVLNEKIIKVKPNFAWFSKGRLIIFSKYITTMISSERRK